MQVFVSWSGGKESCLACFKAISDGVEPSCLLNMVTMDKRRSMTHGIRADILRAQSQCVGIPIIQKRTTWDAYEHDFKETVEELKSSGVEAGVFGDIDIREHREWVERVCRETGIRAVEPLWGIERRRILETFIDAGFKAILVCAKADLFGKEELGRQIDRQFMEDLERRGIDLCGESGEYHTCVLDGPLFRNRIVVEASRETHRDGYWILDIEGYRVAEK